MEYAHKALVLSKKLNDPQRIGTSYLKIARSYHNPGMTTQSMKRYKESQDHFFESMNIRKAIENYNGLAETQCQMTNLYFQMKAEERDTLDFARRLNEAEIRQRKTGQILLAALSLVLAGLILFLLQYFRQRRRLRESEYRGEIQVKLNVISHLKNCISDILYHKRDVLDLRPLEEFNDLMDSPPTAKEYKVLQDVAAGKTNRGIAQD